MLTFFAADPAFATIVANPEAATSSLNRDVAVGVVTYTGAYMFDPVAAFSTYITLFENMLNS